VKPRLARIDPAGRAGDGYRPLLRGEPVPGERHDAEHGGVAGGADGHGVMRAHAVGQLDQPIALDAGLLGIGAEMGLAAAPAVEDDLVARLPGGIVRRLHGAGEIDAGDHGKAAHHGRLAGERESVLVVERGIVDGDGDVALHQISLVEVGERGLGAAIRLLDHDRLEFCHAVLLRHVFTRRQF
jgi:hypothetical protein